MELKYIGNGDSLEGVPARDLTSAEAARFNQQELLDSGLYVEIKPETPKRAREVSK